LTSYLENSLAPSTLQTYRSGARRYVGFCSHQRVTPFPATELVLCLFVVHLARSNLSFKTIRVYLFGVQFHSLLSGFPVKISSMQYLYYTLRGIRRTQGNSLTRPPRSPITVSHLWSMFAFLVSSHFTPHDKSLWRCAIVLAFFGLLRVSEFTCSGVFDPSLHLSPVDISFNSAFSIMYVNIKGSKTDPFKNGCVVRLAAIPGHELCPISAMRRFLSLRGYSAGPLFTLSSGGYLTLRLVDHFLHLSLPGVPNIGTHSFRIGGASAALAAGASDALIRVMGRWSSDCYNRYIRVSDSQISRFQLDLSSAQVTRVWNSDM